MNVTLPVHVPPLAAKRALLSEFSSRRVSKRFQTHFEDVEPELFYFPVDFSIINWSAIAGVRTGRLVSDELWRMDNQLIRSSDIFTPRTHVDQWYKRHHITPTNIKTKRTVWERLHENWSGSHVRPDMKMDEIHHIKLWQIIEFSERFLGLPEGMPPSPHGETYALLDTGSTIRKGHKKRVVKGLIADAVRQSQSIDKIRINIKKCRVDERRVRIWSPAYRFVADRYPSAVQVVSAYDSSCSMLTVPRRPGAKTLIAVAALGVGAFFWFQWMAGFTRSDQSPKRVREESSSGTAKAPRPKAVRRDITNVHNKSAQLTINAELGADNAAKEICQPTAPTISEGFNADRAYPDVAIRRGIEGEVVVRYTVGVDGVVSDLTIVSATPQGYFEKGVEREFRRMRWHPAIGAGCQPVPSEPQTQHVSFKLG